MRRLAPILAGLGCLIAASPALASWSGSTSGSGYTTAASLAAGVQPTAAVVGRNVTVNWQASTGPSLDGYIVKRYASDGTQRSIGAGCSGTVSATSCVEKAVAPGNWRYTVTPARASWRGAESAFSATATVGAPALSLDQTSVTSLPASVAGKITNYVEGQGVTFRLDDPTSGTTLSGTITPSSVPGNGTATVSITLPNGTSNGTHTIYAIGGQSDDVASADVTIAIPLVRTVKASAWDLRDNADGNATELNKSDLVAYAGDSLFGTSGNFSSTFATSRYLELDYYPSLPPGRTVTSPTFDLTFSANANGDTACVYVEVLRASTGSVVGTSPTASAASPVCVTGTTFQTRSFSLQGLVGMSDAADDLRIRVYGRVTGNHAARIDAATVSGSSDGGAFTLFGQRYVDASTGAAAAPSLWPLSAAGDGSFYRSANNWATSYGATRYLKLGFPAEVPSAATVSSVTFRHSYRPHDVGINACYSFEVYSGATLLATRGSAGSPVSCNNSSTTWKTDSVSLGEVKTPAQANSLTVKMYVWTVGGAKTTDHDLAELRVDYTVP